MVGGMSCGRAQRLASTLGGNVVNLFTPDIGLYVTVEQIADLKDRPNADQDLLWLETILNVVQLNVFAQYAYPHADELLRRLRWNLNKPG